MKTKSLSIAILNTLIFYFVTGAADPPVSPAPQPQNSLQKMLNIQWSPGPDLPVGFQDSDGGIVNGSLISVAGFCGGHDNIPDKPDKFPRKFKKDVHAIDLNSPDKGWHSLPDFPGDARQELFAIVVDNQLYCWGGFSYTAPFCYRDGYRLSFQNNNWQWSPLPDLPYSVCSSGIAAIGSKIYFCGGGDYDGNAFYSDHDRNGRFDRLGARLWVFDTKADKPDWQELATCPGTPRWIAPLAAVNDRLFLVGGATGNDNSTKNYCSVVDNWQYSPAEDRWQRMRDLPVASGNFPSGAIVYNNRYLVLVGGYQYENIMNFDGQIRQPYGKPFAQHPDRPYYSDVFVYDTQSNLFGIADSLPLNNNMPMMVLENNRIHLIGGETGGAVLNDSQYPKHPDLYLIGVIQPVTTQNNVIRQTETINLGSHRELFIDNFLIDTLTHCEVQYHHPVPAESDLTNESRAYQTVLKDGDRYRLYYRGLIPGFQGEQADGNAGEITCCNESTDGVHWSAPSLGICEINGSRDNNVILAESPFCHNFTPFIDDNPATPADQRYKALAGLHKKAIPDNPNHGLFAFASPDGLHWRKLADSAIIDSDDFAFDSQNVAFWSPIDHCYVCYFRTWQTPHGKLRTFSRTTSTDFRHWSAPTPIQPNLPGEHLYVSGTHPYFRAPHIFIATPTRFMHNRGDSTDILIMSSRDGVTFDRPFKEAYIWPGLDPARWGNRANYAAWHIVPTSDSEMSIYVKHLRFTLRTDGFASVHAGVLEGQLITKPLTFTGKTLSINFATSAAGSLRVEIQNPDGAPIPGFTRNDCPDIVGDQINRAVSWANNADPASLAGKSIRLLFIMKEADLYSLQFQP